MNESVEEKFHRRMGLWVVAIIWAMVLVMWLAWPAYAEGPKIGTGEWILSMHRLDESRKKLYGEHLTFSYGYISGMIAGMPDTICFDTSNSIPDGVTNGQHHEVVIKYIEDHPQYRHEHVGMLIVRADLDAWCSD